MKATSISRYFETPFWAYFFYFDDVTIVFWHYYDVIIWEADIWENVFNLVKFEQNVGNDC
jgi:hypothetical protein